MSYLKDLSGQKFDRLTVISKSDKLSKNRQTFWNCQCKCGNSKAIRRDALLSGSTRSCGCITKEQLSKFAKTHGKSNTPEFRSWAKMRDRCLGKTGDSYHHYGGRGISICDRWISFDNFLADMGKRPTKTHTLERIDVNGNYEPSNCRWATRYEQSHNRRSNHLISFEGETMTMRQWANHLGMKYSTLSNRINHSKWPIEKALTTPVKASPGALRPPLIR